MRRELGMTIALVVMCLGLFISNPDFLGQSNSINTLRQISMLGIFAIGIGFVIIAGGIDLSIGSVIGLTGVLIAKLSSTQLGGLGYPLWIGIPVALGVALLFGLGQGLLITRLKLQPFIVTLGGMLFLRGVSQTIAGGGTLSLGGSPLLALANGGLLKSGSDALVPYPLLMFLAVSGVAAYALHFTVFGRYVYAIGGNRDAAEYSGINVKRVETSTYVISAGLGGVAGVCYASYIGQMSQQVGIAYEMYAIAAAVLGGCSLRGGEGTVLGIIIGSAVMRVIDNGINMFQLPYEDADRIQRIWRLDPNWTFIIIGAVILVAVILDQIVHIVQTKRRIRHASAGAAEAAPSLQAAVAVSAAEPPAARAPDRESV
ncbi:ABC transporter permease [Sorangium sp. So ce128]|uniref:ABC transporter permease n=1 Tax=Sorangium sp. So ce128 TaxID=3133281 RepID=UPI003F6437C2